MQPVYELWDIESGNLIDAYETEEAALSDVLYAIRETGVQSVEGVMLLRDDHDEQPLTLVVKGAELVEYAQKARARALQQSA